MAEQALQLERTLANVGISLEQLDQLGGDALDEFLLVELTLLAREAVWQLRALARQTRRRWHSVAEHDYPPELKQWLSQVDTLAAREGLMLATQESSGG